MAAAQVALSAAKAAEAAHAEAMAAVNATGDKDVRRNRRRDGGFFFLHLSS
jgi:hypothetical protein